MTATPSAPPEIFNRHLRRLRRDRAASHFATSSFLVDYIADSLLERLSAIKRDFQLALNLDCYNARLSTDLRTMGMAVLDADPGYRFAHGSNGVQCDEDRLPFSEGSFDLIVSAGGLDQVNDLPGALHLIRRCLKPDGLFLAGFISAGSFALLRSALMQADTAVDGKTPARFHPQIDVRSGGDLLGRAGFALPVADGESLEVRYADPIRQMADLRGMAATNLMHEQAGAALTRERLTHLITEISSQNAADGRYSDMFQLLFLTGWAPGPDQPKPARRGSSTVSLGDALKPK